MLYLLDANVLIDAARDYYPLERVPEFWDWLQHLGEHDQLKVPAEVYDEIKRGTDALASWVKGVDVKAAVLLSEEPDPSLVAAAVTRGYAPDLTDEEIEVLGRDPFLIAYALADPTERCVVTTEQSKPRKQRQNRRIPDVCSDLSVQCIGPFQFIRELDFRTGWATTR